MAMAERSSPPSRVERSDSNAFFSHRNTSISYRSFLATRANPFSQAPSSLAWSANVEHLVLFTSQFVVVDEELFEFLDKLSPQVVHVFQRCIAVIRLFDRHDAIVANLLLAVLLFPFDHSDRPTLQQASGHAGFTR